MKEIAVLLVMTLSTFVHSQGLVEFPWNPDSDGDDFIGVNDLMALLSEYGTAFDEEELYLADDSLSATYFLGRMPYLNCAQQCRNLPGRWKIPSWKEIGSVYEGLVDCRQGSQGGLSVSSWHWVETDLNDITLEYGDGRCFAVCNEQNSNSVPQYVGVVAKESMKYLHGCSCYTKEATRMEYSTCQGDDEEFISCCQQKSENGWYPLGGISLNAASSVTQTQAFWRWEQ